MCIKVLGNLVVPQMAQRALQILVEQPHGVSGALKMLFKFCMHRAVSVCYVVQYLCEYFR